MVRKFIDRVEEELDERVSGDHPRRYAETDEPAGSASELRREQHREADEIRGGPGIPFLTGRQAHGALWGGIAGAIVGAIVIGPFGLIPMYDLSLIIRLAITVIVGAVAGATVGAVYFGSRLPELGGESLDADNTPSAGSTLADPRTDSKGRPRRDD